MVRQVVFDTDIGIDDAMALLFLHYARDVEIIGIVSGFGNADIDTTTRNALYLKHRFNIDSPVFRGAGGPIVDQGPINYPDFVHGANGLGEIDIPEIDLQPALQPGPEAMVDLINANPGSVSIIAVGRLTNVALALAIDPELPAKIAELVVMGGAFGHNGHQGNVTARAEANIHGDPEAADLVFQSGMPTTIVGLDVTEETVVDEGYFSALADSAGEAGQFVKDISRYYLDFHENLRGARNCPVHDSSAVAYFLRPDLFATIEGAVSVVLDGDARGQTMLESDNTGRPANCNVCTRVDAEKVRALYAESLACND